MGYILEIENNISIKIKLYKSTMFKNRISIFYLIFFHYIIINYYIRQALTYKQFPILNITLKIDNIGISKIYNGLTPSKMFINGFETKPIQNKYFFNQTNNSITLVYNYEIISCNEMFSDCSNITYIDFSNFDISKATRIDGMFKGCSSLTSLNLSNFNTSQVKNMDDLFLGCSSLKSLNLSTFDTSQVTLMSGMFYNCVSLTGLNLSSFSTGMVTSMNSMFVDCSSLTSLYISNFKTSNVGSMRAMFLGCSSLTSLDLSSFKTDKVEDMWCMFSHCKSLTSLNLTNFSVGRVIDMIAMFSGCSSLTSLDLSSFRTSNGVSMENMFQNCLNLEYINMRQFSQEKCPKTENMFRNVSDNIVVYIDKDKNYFVNELNKVKCSKIDSSSNWKLYQLKVNNTDGNCINNCTGDVEYEDKGRCYRNCTNGYIIIENNKKICKCELEKCQLCPPVALQKKLCSICNTGYYPKENDPLNIGEYINCYKDPVGYYFDETIKLYKECYYTCEKCDIKGDEINHNCLACNPKYSIIKYTVDDNYFNCYSNNNQEEADELIENNQYNHCDSEKPFKNILTEECVRNCSINYILNETCILNYKINDIKNYMEKYIKVQDIVIENFETGFTSDEYNTSNLDNGYDEYFKTEKMKILLTNSENQNMTKYENTTSMDLDSCEILLRNHYNITYNEKIYIKKIDVIQDGMKIPKIEYDIYSKLKGRNLIKLNKTLCEKEKINLFIPLEITQQIEILNSSSDYYNDECYTSTSNYGTDISLNDRKNDFINSFGSPEDTRQKDI